MRSEAIEFVPSAALLDAVIDELDDLGAASGGAVSSAERRAAFAVYRTLARVREKRPPRWRHDASAMHFEDVLWSSGRARVPAIPPLATRRPAGRPLAPSRRTDSAPDGDAPMLDGDAPALAVENAGGIVHLGSTYLEATERLGDARVTIVALADARRTRRGNIDAIAGKIVAPNADRFTALAAAFQNCGAYVDVPAGVELDAPLQIVWTSRPGEASAVFPRTIVRVGEHARATVVERHVGSTESFVCGTVEIDLAPGAELDYVVVQQADDGARVVIRRGVRCAPNARIGWHVADLGGALVRTTIDTKLEGARAAASLGALFFARGFANVELTADVDHRASETRSNTVLRGVATERGQGIARGTIAIRPDTHRCDASFRADGLVLSRDAYLEAVPALDIASNDVAAHHAATIGALDEEELFYVQSRGIARGRAERMIALAFYEPAIARFPSEALRDEVRTALDAALDEIPETFA